MIDLSLVGRLSFDPEAAAALPLSKPPLPPGRNHLTLFGERDAVLVVPENIDPDVPTPLVVLFHGAGGYPEKILPFMEEHAMARRFLLIAPHSAFVTWDIVIGGSGPDLERLDLELAEVFARYRIDPGHLAFAGHSDGGSYALSIGLTNGRLVSHVLAFSAGFMSVLMPEGSPRIFIGHGARDEQCPVDTSARKHARQLTDAGYDVRYVEHNGPHAPQPPIFKLGVDAFLSDLGAGLART